MKTLILIVALALTAAAQDPAPQTVGVRTQRIVQLKYLDPIAVQNLLRNFGVEITADRQLKLVALSGRPAAIDTAVEALKQIDVPNAAQKDIDLTVFFVVGRDDNEPAAGAIPPEIQSTVATLKQTFPYKTYELLDALSLRSRAGSGATATGQLSGAKLTSFSVRAVNLEGGSMIRIDGLHAGIKAFHNGNQYVDVSAISTDIVDTKEGQKLVVGRASMEARSRALFLVLIAKVSQ
jgi:hypothetical protein